jgi:hypothetical protein
MLPTDQSGLIELRFAVLRLANDRRDISAASGVFARRCGSVSEDEALRECRTMRLAVRLRVVPAAGLFFSEIESTIATTALGFPAIPPRVYGGIPGAIGSENQRCDMSSKIKAEIRRNVGGDDDQTTQTVLDVPRFHQREFSVIFSYAKRKTARSER